MVNIRLNDQVGTYSDLHLPYISFLSDIVQNPFHSDMSGWELVNTGVEDWSTRFDTVRRSAIKIL